MAICTFLSHRSPFSKFSRTVSHTGQKPLLQVLPASGVADGPDSRQQMRAAKLSPFRKSERWNSKLWEFILLTLSLILDHSSLILDPWSFIFDPLSLIFDPWSLIHDPWSLILDPWSMILDSWSLILICNMEIVLSQSHCSTTVTVFFYIFRQTPNPMMKRS